MKSFLLTFLLLITISGNSEAQSIDATLLEINFSGDSNPVNITKGSTKIYFSAYEGTHGRELWVHNTISNSTEMVKDINIGSQSGLEYASKFITIQDQLYFSANDGIHGNELWTSDGTEAGTYLIKDINNLQGSSISEFIVLNGVIFFSANDGTNGQELWTSDGSTEGTFLLKDMYLGINSGYPSDFFVFNNNIYFIANNEINGMELWKTNGTTIGTTLLKDINTANYVSSISPGNNFIIFNNNFYFIADNGVVGYELWKSDGTTSGTQLLKDIFTGGNSSTFKLNGSATNNYFVFEAHDLINGNELWKSDGTSLGTVLLKDINTNGNGLNDFSEFATYNDKVYFTANDNLSGQELWVTDGTLIGTQMVKDINPGNNSSNIYSLKATSNFIIFSAHENFSTSNKLWKSDGTTDGTILLKAINVPLGSNETDTFFTELNNLIYFSGGEGDGSGIGYELWKTDGTLINTSLIIDVYHPYGNNTQKEDIIAFNNKAIFSGTDGIHGEEPFITDGTIAGTKMIKDINPEYSSLNTWNDQRASYTKAGNNVFFRATNGTLGYELFKTDGTESGTSMVKDISIGNNSSLSDYTLFMTFNDILYFRANDQIHGEELWRTDGTEEGTYLLKDINAGSASGITSSNMINTGDDYVNTNCYGILNGYLYFTALDNLGYGIWKTDGTTNNTTKVLSFPDTQSYNFPPVILNANSDKIFFMRKIDDSSWDYNSLWSSDGTQAGTSLLGTWGSNNASPFKRNLIFNNEFYFTVLTLNGAALMKSDGTQSGTIPVTNPNFTPHYSFQSLVSCGNYIYFSIRPELTNVGKELWRTDGTIANTVLIEEIPLEASTFFYDCKCIQNNLFFINDFQSNKIWYVDNSSLTTNYFEINFQYGNSFQGISHLYNLNDNILVDHYSEETGLELYYSNVQNLLNLNTFVENTTQLEKIKVFPNPTNDKINISVSDNSKIKTIAVYNSLGKNVYSINNVMSNFIDLSRFSSGIYFIQIKTESITETKKVIVN